MTPLPPLVFVLGKGGVGRSTVSAALGLACAARGERTLVVQWAVADAISRWFERASVGHLAGALAPGLETMNFSAEATMREYFVDHLHLPSMFRFVVSNRHVRRATRAVPGFEEMWFLGRLMWLTTLAREDLGWSYDRVIVDAPALGHGLSLFAVPSSLAALGLGGLMAGEIARVSAMLGDATRSAALMVTTAEELAVDETLELWPRVRRELGRAPVACVLNRAIAPALAELPARPEPWYVELERSLTTRPARDGLRALYATLARRRQRERELTARLGDTPLVVVEDGLFAGARPPRALLDDAAAAVAPLVAAAEVRAWRA